MNTVNSLMLPRCFVSNQTKTLIPLIRSVARKHAEHSIVVFGFGLGSKTERKTFYKYKDDTVSSFLEAEDFLPKINPLHWESLGMEMIDVKMLNDVIFYSGIVPDIMKISAQGFDL